MYLKWFSKCRHCILFVRLLFILSPFKMRNCLKSIACRYKFTLIPCNKIHQKTAFLLHFLLLSRMKCITSDTINRASKFHYSFSLFRRFHKRATQLENEAASFSPYFYCLQEDPLGQKGWVTGTAHKRKVYVLWNFFSPDF